MRSKALSVARASRHWALPVRQCFLKTRSRLLSWTGVITMRANVDGKVIVTCAGRSSIHTPSMSEYLPVTAAEIAESAIGAAEAGAAVVHLHARNPEDGRADQTPEAFAPILKAIKSRSNVVLNITTGGSPLIPLSPPLPPA